MKAIMLPSIVEEAGSHLRLTAASRIERPATAPMIMKTSAFASSWIWPRSRQRNDRTATGSNRRSRIAKGEADARESLMVHDSCSDGRTTRTRQYDARSMRISSNRFLNSIAARRLAESLPSLHPHAVVSGASILAGTRPVRRDGLHLDSILMAEITQVLAAASNADVL